MGTRIEIKTISAAVISVALLIGAPLSQHSWANKADTEQEAGIASDAQDRICNFDANNDECHDEYLLTHNPYWSQGFKTGYDDAISGHYDKNTYAADIAEGYFAGWHQGCRDSGRTTCTH